MQEELESILDLDFVDHDQKQQIRELLKRKLSVAHEITKLCESRLHTFIPCCQNSSMYAVSLHATQSFYKVVAASKKGFISIYDGETRYQLGKWTRSRRACNALLWPPLTSCFFVASDPHIAAAAHYPKDAKQKLAPRVLLRVDCRGKAYVHKTGHYWAVERVRPVQTLQFHAQTNEPFLLPCNFASNEHCL